METYQVRLPNGKVVSRQLQAGLSDADVQAAFMPAYRAAGFKSAGAVVRPSFENDWRKKLGDQGAIAGSKPNLGQKLTNYLSGGLTALGVDGREAARLGSKWFTALNDLTPLGNATMADEGVRKAQMPGWWNKVEGTGLTALAVLPGAAGRVGRGMFGRGIRAWHGSPHDFDRFSLDKIGTGEGAQAYGHGLYFAENRNVAEDYQRQLSGGVLKRPDGSLLDPSMAEDRNEALVAKYLVQHKEPETARKALLSDYVGPHQQRQLSAKLDEMIAAGVRPAGSGRLYEVNINAKPEELLDWEAPMWRQPAAVQRLLQNSGDLRGKPELKINQTPSGRFSLRNIWGEAAGTFKTHEAAEAKANELAESWGRMGGQLAYQRMGGNPIYHHLDKGDASRALWEAGVPGLKYFDQGSRGAGTGTRNYVVFDDSIVDILNKY